jgi:Protein of unknown function (DUF2905)
MNEIGKFLVGIGLSLAMVGILLLVAGRIGMPLGRFPGDFAYRSKHVSLYFPLGTCILISVLLTAILYLLSKFRG